MRRLALAALVLAVGCAGRTRAPLPVPPSALVATPEEAFLDPPDPLPGTRPPALPIVIDRVLSNGMHLFFVQRSDIPSTSVVYACRAGGGEDRGVTRGVDPLLERVLERIAHQRSVARGGDAHPTVSIFDGGVEVATVGSATSLWAMVDNVAAVVRAPTFDPAMVIELRHVMFEEIAPAARGSSWMLGIHQREMIFGPVDPRAQPWYGDQAVFGSLQADALRARHAQLFTPSESAIVIVGDAEIDPTQELVRRHFEDWSAPAVHGTRLGAAAFPTPSARLHAIPAGGDETLIHVREHAPTHGDPDRAAFEVATALLGGMFGARVNRIVREERGHTYGVHASIADHRDYAIFELDLTIPATHIRDTIFTIIDELRRIQDASQIGDAELAAGRATAVAAYRRAFATRGATAVTLANLFVEGSDPAVLDARASAAESVTAEDVARAARAWIRPDAAPILAVGSYRDLQGAIYMIPGGSEFVVWRW